MPEILLLPDDRRKLSEAMRELADEQKVELIVTTGGTGFAKDDCTPEATLDIVERRADGIPEAMRAYSSQFTDRAMLSRAAAGIRGETVIINLPGSVKAVEECMDCVENSLIHGIEILTGKTGECARQSRYKRRVAYWKAAVGVNTVIRKEERRSTHERD